MFKVFLKGIYHRVGWHHQTSGCEFEQTLGDSEGWEAWRAAVYRVTESNTT